MAPATSLYHKSDELSCSFWKRLEPAVDFASSHPTAVHGSTEFCQAKDDNFSSREGQSGEALTWYVFDFGAVRVSGARCAALGGLIETDALK